MRIDVTQLAEGENSLSVEESPAEVGLEPAGTIEETEAVLGAAFDGPLHAEFRVTRRGDEMLVDAALESPATLQCARCLAVFGTTLAGGFRVFCRRAATGQAIRPVEDELDEGGVVYYGGRYLDLRGAVREAVLLAVPMRPLCRDECRGLCPGCGADLNIEDCSCVAMSGGAGSERASSAR